MSTPDAAMLTERFWQRWYDDSGNPDFIDDASPFLQVLHIRKSQEGSRTWMRLVLSDGFHYLPVFLAFKLHYMVEKDTARFTQFDVIEPQLSEQGLQLFITGVNLSKTKKVARIIGNPTYLLAENARGQPRLPQTEQPNMMMMPGSSQQSPPSQSIVLGNFPGRSLQQPIMHALVPSQPMNTAMGAMNQQGSSLQQSPRAPVLPSTPNPITLISELHVLSFGWTIRARVTQKKTLGNREGEWFKVFLRDESASVQAVCFQGKTMYDRLQEGRTYMISEADLKEPDKRYNSDPIELRITHSTQIEDCTPPGGTSPYTPPSNHIPVRTLGSVQDELSKASDDSTSVTFRTTVEITQIFPEGLMYASCTSAPCRKKVVQEEEGGPWKCKEGHESFQRPIYRYKLKLRAQDFVTNIYMQCWDDIGRQLLGMSANDLELIQNNAENLFHVLRRAYGKWDLVCQAKWQSSGAHHRSINFEITQAQRTNALASARNMRDVLMRAS